MSQTYTANCYQSDHVAVTDMANIEANFATLRSTNSGAAAPSNTEAGLQWWDTVKNRLKIRNDANAAWLAVLHGSASFKIWVYRNTTDDGWTIDATVTDRVLALKGGTGLYNANGGTNAGETWANLKAHTHTGPSHTHSHNHMVYNWDAGDDGRYYTTSGADTMADVPNTTYQGGRNLGVCFSDTYEDRVMGADMYTSLAAVAGGTANTGAQSTADVRPQAAVGTLQYPDI
jgi:hypothetical protein